MKAKLAGLAVALMALAAGLVLDVRTVGGEDMLPSHLPGDVVVFGPGAPSHGDVVLLTDPSDPERTVLRRVLGLAGDTAVIDGAELSLQGVVVRRREMERTDARVVTNEGDLYLTQTLPREHSEPTTTLTVPADHVLVLADNRDQALDSRWWGPIPADAIHGRALVRLGSSDAWRGAITFGSVDGPWIPPSKQPLD
ncbi:MAG: signal peptidase I [Proteobacteria bacterium]|nr:signal peptidase I [Pseudomonadota bacterium]MCP4916902.1 signal peptidase I [Pseudomonadota bacterium]